MGTASVVAAIGFAAVVFMLRFLIALLREAPPAVCYWVVPVRQNPERTVLQCWSGNYVDDDCRQEAWKRGHDRVELLENENHEKEWRGSSPIAFDVRTIPGRLGWRAIDPKRACSFHERRL